MEVEEQITKLQSISSNNNISKSTAVLACAAMTTAYVAVLHSPTLIFRRQPPTSFNQFMIRRFFCAFVSSLLCVLFSSFLLLPVQNWKFTSLFSLYGVQPDHVWHALVFPFSLTSLVYAGSLVLKCLLLLDSWNGDESEGIRLNSLLNMCHKIYCTALSFASNITAWRNLVVAPITEELVFRACMIPLLLCGGFKSQVVLLFCPIFFSLAHLNHLLEFYYRKNYSLQKTSIAVGTQLAYTMIFGSYASFLFIRTGVLLAGNLYLSLILYFSGQLSFGNIYMGHLIAPLVAHVVCNFMGLPAVYANRNGVVISLAFITGTTLFVRLIFPMTSPALYNNRIDNCHCWQGYCSWS